VNVTARAAGTIEKVTKDELETVMQVRVARCRTQSVSRLVNPRFTLNPVRKRKKAPFPNVDVGRARDATRSRLTTLDTLSSRFPSHVVVSPRCHASRAS
jgi:hypothetical protein